MAYFIAAWIGFTGISVTEKSGSIAISWTSAKFSIATDIFSSSSGATNRAGDPPDIIRLFERSLAVFWTFTTPDVEKYFRQKLLKKKLCQLHWITLGIGKWGWWGNSHWFRPIFASMRGSLGQKLKKSETEFRFSLIVEKGMLWRIIIRVVRIKIRPNFT